MVQDARHLLSQEVFIIIIETMLKTYDDIIVHFLDFILILLLYRGTLNIMAFFLLHSFQKTYNL